MTDSSSPSPAAAPVPLRRNLILTFGANVGILAVTFATGTLNARLLGPTGRGELAAIQTLPAVLGALALIGLPSAVGYYSAQRPKETRTFTVTASLITFLVSLPAVLVGFLLMPWVLRQQSATVVHDARIFLAQVSMHMVLVPYVALQGIGAYKAWNVLRLFPNVANLVAICLATAAGHRTSGAFAKTYLALYSLSLPVAYIVLWRESRRLGAVGKTRIRGAGELVHYGLPSALMIPASLLNLQLDQLMMAGWLSSELLGLYAVSCSWSALLSPVFNALGSVLFPALAAASDLDAKRILVARGTRLAILSVILLGAGLAACTPLLLPMLFGRAFSAAVPAALILVVASMVLSLNGLTGEILRGLGAPRWPLFSQLAALPVTVGMLFVLLPRLNIVGAAISSLIAYSVTAVVSLRGVSGLCRLRLRDLLVPRSSDVRELREAVHGILRRLSRGRA